MIRVLVAVIKHLYQKQFGEEFISAYNFHISLGHLGTSRKVLKAGKEPGNVS